MAHPVAPQSVDNPRVESRGTRDCNPREPRNIRESIVLAWGSVAPTVITIPEVEAALAGTPLTQETFTELAPLVSSAVDPIDDVRASTDYRRMVSGRLLLRLGEYAGYGAPLASCPLRV